MNSEDGAPTPKKESVPRHYIVQSDDRDLTDVGLITVDYDQEQRELRRHWITLPDGTVRRMYNSKHIDATDMGLLDAFETMPRLHVSYRPVTLFIREYAEWWALILITVLGLDLISGFCLMTVFISGYMDVVLSYSLVYYASVALVIMTPLVIAIIPVAQLADRRWDKITKDDMANNIRNEKEREIKKQIADGIAAGHRGTGRIG